MLYRLVYHVLRFFKRFPYVVPLILLAVVVSAFGGIIGAKIYQHLDRDRDRGAIAMKDGAYGENYETPRYLKQGWSRADSLWFYNTTQGSGLMPYDFFLALNTPGLNEKFSSPKNIDRFRYLPQKKTLFNPDALPVGFVKETYRGKDYVGFTCAACHTSQINHNGRAVRIDGGPAMADMVKFLTELKKAMDAAKNDDNRETFIKAVQERNSKYKREDIIADLHKWTETIGLYNVINHSEVEYGPARLDAFGRIYNRVLQHSINKGQLKKELELVVLSRGDKKHRMSEAQVDKVLDKLGDNIVFTDDEFSLILQRLRSPEPAYPGLSYEDLLAVRDKIFNPANAPVSYPFLWDIAHSDYVQWNGVASNADIGPLGRNAGEVIGVFGILDWGRDKSWFGLYGWLKQFSPSGILSGQKDKKEVVQFESSINLFNLHRLESNLRRLKSPEWPFCRNEKGEYYLPELGPKAVSPSEKKGKYCSGTDKRFNDAWKRNGELIYIARCQSCHTVVDRSAWDRVVIGNMLSLRKAGTDKAMAENSVKYRGKSGNFKDTYQKVDVGSLVVEEDAPVLQILTAATRGVVATPDHGKWFLRRMVEWIYVLVASIGDNTIKASIKMGNYDPDTTAEPYASLLAYRARSLNGIWATAPYLHNGSVRTLEDLLLPPDDRPQSFKVGTREFDPESVGFKNQGYFDFKTDQRGNLRTGHSYGTTLSKEDRRDLIEYLTSL